MNVQVKALTVDFRAQGVRALDDVDLQIDEGEHVVLLGPSGSGKTTLLRSLAGATRTAAGSVRVGGLNPYGPASEVRRLRQCIGIVRQRDDLVIGLSARANAVMGTAPGWRLRDWLTVVRGGVPGDHVEWLEELARHHGISGCLSTRIEQLSGGQRRRVAIVRALLAHPRLILADEPTTGLDPRTAVAALTALQEADAATLILTTHDLDIARRFGRVIAVRAGRVVHDGSMLSEGDVERIYGAPT